MTAQIFSADRVFDGHQMRAGQAILVESGQIVSVAALDQMPKSAQHHPLGAGVLCPGFVDLQVNGGGGVMLNGDPSVNTLRQIAAAHLTLGTTALLPTLITDRPEVMAATIKAVAAARAAGVPGIIGLHLEGPHLDPLRAGAHDPDLMRPMTDADVALYLGAKPRVGTLKLTVAPNQVTPARITRLVAAGIIVSLGHSDASYDQAMAAIDAGASCITHLFNAMSGLGHRTPGLAGAALSHDAVSVGLIADGVHVHPAALRVTAAAKNQPDGIFLVSDAMAVTGTDMPGFYLQGRHILRADGELRLPDGTLAGADLSLPQAIRVMTTQAAVPLERGLRMATAAPAAVIGQADLVGRIAPGRAANLVFLHDDLTLGGVWQSGQRAG